MQEEETPRKRNIRPKETSRLPLITLLTLLAIIVALFAVGWEYITDDVTGSEEVTDIVPDTTSKFIPPSVDTEPDLAEPERVEPAETSLPEDVGTPVAVQEPPAETPAPEKKTVDVGGTAITHTVRPGETFFGIANKYNLSTETLKALNPQLSNTTTDLKSGVTKLNVRVQAVHTVGPGDVLRVVAKKYGISLQLLMEANGKTRNYSERGEKLIIPFGKKK
ncbi:LysM peptidoglycan-binding domain-containing protein [Salmonirosea aquatica]|uniref:LysM peptidoglycan-binding domain-containing protein n=1 Tax=Salmonirosea aquatica TaxID=2654236 RepID=A0A7C9FR06_9BACT|nr:LysM peptidoglycan-binding domain-containing protein [Cytophagaceae bacterium SJW1-29]